MPTPYNSAYTGAQVDAAIETVRNAQSSGAQGGLVYQGPSNTLVTSSALSGIVFANGSSAPTAGLPGTTANMTAGRLPKLSSSAPFLTNSIVAESGNTLLVATATTGVSYVRFSNTSGAGTFGIEGNLGGTTASSSTAYATLVCTTTATPVELGVNSAIYWRVTTAGAWQSVGANTITTTTGTLNITTGAGNGNITVSCHGTGDFVVFTNQFYVDQSAGFVGIGTVTPTSIAGVNRCLDISGTTASIVLTKTSTGTKQWEMFNDGNGLLRFYSTDGADTLTLTQGGRIGCRTTSPLSVLHANVGTSDVSGIFVDRNSNPQAILLNPDATVGAWIGGATRPDGTSNASSDGAGRIIMQGGGTVGLTFQTSAATTAGDARTWTTRWAITNAGVLTATGAQTITTSTGALTLSTSAGNGDVIASPHGTGVFRVSSKIKLSTDGVLTWGDAADYGTLTWDTGKAVLIGQSGKALSMGANGSDGMLYISTAGNIGVGVTSFGTSADKVIGIGNGTEPSSSPADMVQLYSVDLSPGNATLGIRTETAVAVDVIAASTHSLSVRINGTTYKILLST